MSWMMVVAPLVIIAVILLWVGATLWAGRAGGRNTAKRPARSQRGEVAGGTHVGGPGSANTLGPEAAEVNDELAQTRGDRP